MTNDTSLESSFALLLESAKKLANLQKLNFFFAKSNYIVKMFAKKNQNLTTESGSKQRFSRFSSHSGSVPKDSGS